MSEYALEITNLHKSFRLPTEKAGKLKTAVLNAAKGIRGYKEQKVLEGIDFKVKKGEFFGIVGRNGSGKSTLLKIISGIYQPTKGAIKVNGKLVPFIELGVGFNPELTGHENVYLNGALLGFSNKEIDEMYDEIVDFAELSEFMGQKLKNYSSGMQVRLAFSLAIRSHADILVLDEILAVGDEAFQRKCYEYFTNAKRNQKTIILVSHSMDQIQQFCDRAIFIHDGKIIKSGNPAKIAAAYREANNQCVVHAERPDRPVANEYVRVQVETAISPNDVTLTVKIVPLADLDNVAITIAIGRDSGEWVYRFATNEKIKQRISLVKNTPQTFRLKLENIFCDGLFSVQIGIKNHDDGSDYILVNDAGQFRVKNPSGDINDILWKPKEKFTTISSAS